VDVSALGHFFSLVLLNLSLVQKPDRLYLGRTVKNFLRSPMFLQEGSPAAGLSFFVPDR
jgi:hypothetical protein